MSNGNNDDTLRNGLKPGAYYTAAFIEAVLPGFLTELNNDVRTVRTSEREASMMILENFVGWIKNKYLKNEPPSLLS